MLCSIFCSHICFSKMAFVWKFGHVSQSFLHVLTTDGYRDFNMPEELYTHFEHLLSIPEKPLKFTKLNLQWRWIRLKNIQFVELTREICLMEMVIPSSIPNCQIRQQHKLHRPLHLSQLSKDKSVITCKSVHVPNPVFGDSCVKFACLNFSPAFCQCTVSA